MVAAEHSLNIQNEEHSPTALVSQDEETGQIKKRSDRLSFHLHKGRRSSSQLYGSHGSTALNNQGSRDHNQSRKPTCITRLSVEDHSSTWHLDIETGNIQQDLIRPSDLIKSADSLDQDDVTCRHCCGLRGATARIIQAGGDFPSRLDEALRASLGTCMFFSAMVFPHPKYLGAIWIGNIFFHSSLKGSVGETVKTACDFARSMIITTLISYPVAYFLERITERTAQLCLPVFTVLLSL